MSGRYALIESTAILSAVAASAGAAAGAVLATTGDVNGAPGISKALSRLGRFAGGGMVRGIAVTAGAAALVGLAVYEGVRQLDRL